MYRENELFLQDGGELDIESIAETFEGEWSTYIPSMPMVWIGNKTKRYLLKVTS